METTALLKENSESKIFTEFHRSGTFGNPVTVYRYLPDNANEPIGTIYTNYNEVEDAVIYTCFDRSNKMLFTPTDDYNLAQSSFELFAKQLTVKSIEQQKGSKTQGFIERIQELKEIHNKKQELNKHKEL